MSIAALSQSIPGHAKCQPQVDAFFEKRTCSVQYVVSDPATRCCALVDPVLDYDEKSGSIATWSADAFLAFICDHDVTVEWIFDTHPHAGHFFAAGHLKDRTGAKTTIGERMVDVQGLWQEIYNLSSTFAADGSQWDRLVAEGDVFQFGTIDVRAALCLVRTGSDARVPAQQTIRGGFY
jgi:glyoxylase-like metal-dependent hydrolase (beta-lactamase superfamily II)